MQTIQQFPTWFSKQKRGGKLAIGCGGLLLFFCLCTFFAALLSPSPSNAEAASTSADVSGIQTSAFETAVEKVYQTATANVPTITPTPNLPTPTASPFATQTPPPTGTSETDPYLISMREKVPSYADAFITVYSYNQEVANDISLLFDTSWKTKQGLALGLLDFAADDMAAVQPSPKYASLHAIVTQLAAETKLFTDLYARGVDNLDADLINEATLHLQNMNALMEQATAELQRIEAIP
jgi:hypothetical protein